MLYSLKNGFIFIPVKAIISAIVLRVNEHRGTVNTKGHRENLSPCSPCLRGV